MMGAYDQDCIHPACLLVVLVLVLLQGTVQVPLLSLSLFSPCKVPLEGPLRVERRGYQIVVLYVLLLQHLLTILSRTIVLSM